MFPRVRRLAVEHLHLPNGVWRSPGFVEIDAQGTIAALPEKQPENWRGEEITTLKGFAIPGLPNVHSHAFQRALVGRTEKNEPGKDDSFWTWRELMYRLAGELTPDDIRALSAALYVEMLEAGMTAVGEFHYLHHAPDGRPYDDPAEMSLQLIEAAKQAGIAITMLPVLYQRGGFNRPAEPRQKRFLHFDVQAFLQIFQRITAQMPAAPLLRAGIAPHSLRAVPPEALREAVGGIDPEAPVHIHVAEQTLEVEQCLQNLGARPVAWLQQNFEIDRRWCLVHATHVDENERRALAASGAIAGLCPTTEANLGDGLFPALEYLRDKGAISVGTDSHASVSAAEELRLLEYGQRLKHQKRNLLGDARRLWDAAAIGGATALAQPIGAIAVGKRADLVILDREHPRLIGHGPSTVLDAFVFGAAERAVREVICGGLHVVTEGAHRQRAPVIGAYRRVVDRLFGAS